MLISGSTSIASWITVDTSFCSSVILQGCVEYYFREKIWTLHSILEV